MVKERCKRKPVSKILGYRSFWGRDFEINENVLDPRGDTETLIELILACKFKNMLELGTGSGAIAITVLAERPDVTCVATDISEYALKTASTNSKRHGVESRLKLLHSNWFEKISGSFDVIVSNPPYINKFDLSRLDESVKIFEPYIAFEAGIDGLREITNLIIKSKKLLKKNGKLIFEIGQGQSLITKKILNQNGYFINKVIKDISSIPRVIVSTNLI